ncbi:SugE protein [Stutzerimonas stutzeri A1501]|uniref:Guanidinium exporter n=3 Tax=Stutzerimonas stutzeri TaxID=316 RepID=A4VQ69_STUS1|nr:SugE protein [Stutzerimonas stutzeri A1501]
MLGSHPPRDDPGRVESCGDGPAVAGVIVMHSAWIMLIIAGLLEVGWAIGLKASEGFTRPLPSVLTLVAMAASFFLLARAMQVLPVGTAYAIWVGIGALGTVALGIVIFGESASPARLLSAVLLLAGLVGLKLTA